MTIGTLAITAVQQRGVVHSPIGPNHGAVVTVVTLTADFWVISRQVGVVSFPVVAVEVTA